MTTKTALPPVVDRETWAQQIVAIRAKEKALTREHDALAAQRRRLPMVPVSDFTFEGANGKIKLADIFQGHSQLISYSHMWNIGDEWQCHGCSNFTSQYTPAIKGLAKYDARFVFFADAPFEDIQANQAKMGSQVTFYSTHGTDFMKECGDLNDCPFALNVFLRDEDKVYRTWFTSKRGVENAHLVSGLLDMLPYGRQEEWQDSPQGWPQTTTMRKWSTAEEIAENAKSGVE